MSDHLIIMPILIKFSFKFMEFFNLRILPIGTVHHIVGFKIEVFEEVFKNGFGPVYFPVIIIIIRGTSEKWTCPWVIHYVVFFALIKRLRMRYIIPAGFPLILHRNTYHLFHFGQFQQTNDEFAFRHVAISVRRHCQEKSNSSKCLM
jgi:hypothetical protein